jgi:4-hydroxybenzoate polyprenyltransferase
MMLLSYIISYIQAIRFESWFGWVFSFSYGCVLWPLRSPPLYRAVSFLVAFFLATASIFLINQYFDREVDQENEVKKELPLASGRVTSEGTILFSALLVASCLIIVFAVDRSLLYLFLVYLGLLVAYSAPPFRLKTKPIVDLLVAGIGSGLLPFLIGIEVSHQLSDNLSFPWVRKRYFDAFLTVIPLILFNSSLHIIQAVGDYESDRKAGLHTFVVRYGREKSVLVAGLMSLASILSLAFYFSLSLIPIDYLMVIFLLLPLMLPIVFRYIRVLREPSRESVFRLTRITTKYGPPILFFIWIFVYFLKNFS